MSPSAVYPETTTQLTNAGVIRTIAKTAPSLVKPPNGTASANGSPLAELDASKMICTWNKDPRSVPGLNSPEVWAQNTCTDHMVTCKWTSTAGWEAPHLQPYGPFSIMPTASVLHYATECFEGMKLYRGFDSRLRIFRPDRNTRRMVTSATRIALPAFNPDELEKIILKLCGVDGEKWLPKSRSGTFLYLRPTMIGTADALGMQTPREALLYVIACCFPSLDEPAVNLTLPLKKAGLRLLASEDDMVRAWPGGFGYAKVGANYGPSLLAQAEARERGYDQILWLFGKDCEITEAGASNFFVVWKTDEGILQLVTAPLDDKVVLDGVTRRSVLDLARERLDLEVVERKFTMEEMVEVEKDGRLIEAFVSGTAFFISAISQIHFRGLDLDIPLAEGMIGTYAGLIKGWLRSIMYGKEQHPWGVVVDEEGVGNEL